MGKDVVATQFSREDRTRYRQKVRAVPGVTDVRVVCFRDPDDVLLEYIEFANKPWGT